MTDEYLFISDCHLDSEKPAISANLIKFLRERAASARCLYILGDLFEVWLGDDDPAPAHSELIETLFDLSKNTRLYFLAGNRDFLLGDDLARRAGLEIIAEPVLLNLGHQGIVLLHGDLLCTDDHDYQAFRKTVRSPKWQTDFLQKPLIERQEIAIGLRSESLVAMAQKKAAIMDVNRDAVVSCFEKHDVEIIIHGHTHRPGIHLYPQAHTRYVLGNWNPEPSYLSWRGATGFVLQDPRV
ncbi:MAG: UDP-2,3-diacylglucosamine diphosphatase [Gammaproteobacteria bacterium]